MMLAAPAPPTPAALDAAPGRRLRVADITDFYSDTVSGGVKTYLHAKAAAMEALGIEHVVVVPGDRPGVDRLGATRLVRTRGWRVPVSRSYRVMLSATELRGILERERPDVVEVGSPFIVPHLVRLAMAGRSVPTVGFYHADVVRTFAEPYVPHRLAAPLRVLARMAARVLVRRVYLGFHVTVAASASVARELRELGIPDVRCIGLGVDLETFRPPPALAPVDWRAYGVEPGVRIGIYAGRFCPEKRLDVLLDGHARIPPDRRPHLVLVGGGPDEEALRARARVQGRLSVVPYVRDRAALARLYSSADFYLATGPGETFGLSIAEALACGLPVVAVDRGAAPDRVEGSGVAELYHHGDAESAGAAVVRLVARLSPELRARARRHAERSFDWRRTFEAMAELYYALAPLATRRP